MQAYTASHSQAAIMMRQISLNKFALLINRLGESDWFEISVSYNENMSMKRQLIDVNRSGLNYLNEIKEMLVNCSAILVNFEPNDTEVVKQNGSVLINNYLNYSNEYV